MSEFSGAELQNARFTNPGHPYPALCVAGLGHLWVGPRRTDWDPAFLAAVGRHLGKYNLPKARGDQLRCVSSKLMDANWLWFETLEEEGKAHVEAANKRREESETAARTPKGPPRLQEMSEAERNATLERIQAARKLAKRRDSSDDHFQGTDPADR
ncbi:MAG: hypothetical protein AAFX78_01885 [Cyanobacteria bacterium J06638_20]